MAKQNWLDDDNMTLAQKGRKRKVVGGPIRRMPGLSEPIRGSQTNKSAWMGNTTTNTGKKAR